MRHILIVIGCLAVAMGVAGIVLPLVPATPFLLLAAACFSRASPRLNAWLHDNRWFGPYLRSYKSGLGLPLHGKIGILVFLWLSLASSALWGVPRDMWAVQLLLLAIGIGVSIHVARMRTARRADSPVATEQRSTDQ
ncbi:MAG: hypothetical protein RL173_1932 [Fibrobacterota bacterium]|jgi:uncharacterized membrane protein YbaN (DUF454 family)